MPAALTTSAFVLLVLSVSAIFLLCNNEKYSFLKTIHREKKAGSLISALALVWAGVQGYELLGQDFPAISSVIPILIPALIVGVYFLMDYIFTRAVGGLMILLICDLFYQGQFEEMPARFLFSLIGYTLAIAGMYMIGQPWRFRDLLFKSIENKDFGKKLAVGITSAMVVMFIPFIMIYV